VDTRFYQDLLDRISDGVYFVNRDRQITYWNPWEIVPKALGDRGSPVKLRGA
jgi:hypothetical protein